MKDFSKATPRPWIKGNDYSTELYGKVTIIGQTGTAALAHGSTIEEARSNSTLIVTAVNNFDKMKEAIIKANDKLAYLYGYNLGKDAVSDVPDILNEIKQLLESIK